MNSINLGHLQNQYKNNSENVRIVSFFWVLSAASAMGCMVSLIVHLVHFNAMTIMIQGIVTLFILANLKLASLGHLKVACFLFCILLITGMSANMFMSQGIHDMALLTFPAILFIAALLLHGKEFFVILAYILMVPIYFVSGELFGFFQVKTSTDTNISVAIDVLLILIVTAITARLFSKQLLKSHQESHKLSLEIQQKNHDLEKLNFNLEERVQNRTAELNQSLDQLKRAQNELIEQEKLASLGGVVAGVAHEINTPIGVALTAASFLSDHMNDFEDKLNSGHLKKSELLEFMEQSKKSAQILVSNLERGAQLIRSFKQVAVDQNLQDNRSILVGDYILDIFNSLKPEIKNGGHHFEINIHDNPSIFGQPSTLWQIMSNLVMNSLIHGFADGRQGLISIEVTSVETSAIINYSDNGLGMTPEVLKRIYEPFFTTRRGSGGSGLGMNIVYSLVTHSFNGKIQVQSSLGEGCKFTIIIPLEFA